MTVGFYKGREYGMISPRKTEDFYGSHKKMKKTVILTSVIAVAAIATFSVQGGTYTWLASPTGRKDGT